MMRFGDVVSNVDNNERDPLANGLERYVGLEHLDPESLHIQRWGLIEEGTSFTRKFVAGQVLFGKRRAYQHKASVADFNGICSGDILVFEAKDDLLPELLPFIVQSDSFYEHALNTSAGSLSPRTKWKDLADYEFALPPKDEQRRIADILWAADENLCQSENLLRAAISHRKVLLNYLLENGIKSSDWPEVLFGTLMTGSPRSGYSAISTDKFTGHYVLALPALSQTGYQKGYIKPVDFTPEVEKALLKKGDLLISRSNTLELVGLVGIFDEDREDISFPDTMMLIDVDEKKIHKRFLEQVLLSDLGRSHVRRIAAGTSASMKKINRAGLSSLIIPLPSIDEQIHILKLLDACMNVVHSGEYRRDNCRKLRYTLLKGLLANE